MRYGYLLEIQNVNGQKTDLFEIWPKSSCNVCNGTGDAGHILVKHRRHVKEGPAILSLCRCLENQERRTRQRQCR